MIARRPAIITTAATIEGLVLARCGRYDWRACLATLVELICLSIAAPVIARAHAHRIATMPLVLGLACDAPVARQLAAALRVRSGASTGWGDNRSRERHDP
jgi:hypothetical protein